MLSYMLIVNDAIGKEDFATGLCKIWFHWNGEIYEKYMAFCQHTGSLCLTGNFKLRYMSRHRQLIKWSEKEEMLQWERQRVSFTPFSLHASHAIPQIRLNSLSCSATNDLRSRSDSSSSPTGRTGEDLTAVDSSKRVAIVKIDTVKTCIL